MIIQKKKNKKIMKGMRNKNSKKKRVPKMKTRILKR